MHEQMMSRAQARVTPDNSTYQVFLIAAVGFIAGVHVRQPEWVAKRSELVSSVGLRKMRRKRRPDAEFESRVSTGWASAGS